LIDDQGPQAPVGVEVEMMDRAKGTGWSWRRGLVLGASLAGSAGCIANVPVEAPTAEVGEYPTSEFELASGMQVVLERAPDVGVATVVLMIGAGSADEPAGKAGVAHLAEHLVFETRGDGELPLKKRLEARAAAWNGSTDWDATSYTNARSISWARRCGGRSPE
jgi:hypothetical protein